MVADHTKKLRLLVADDSAFARGVVISLLEDDRGIVIAGQAENGLQAVQMAAELKPDLVVMDIEMPVLDGIGAIERIMTEHPVPILVVTSRGDAATAFSALSKGALEVMEKPELDMTSSVDLIKKVRLLAGVRVITHLNLAKPPVPFLPGKNLVLPGNGKKRIVAVAASTGGPHALSVVLSSLPADFPAPIVVAQHIAEGFTAPMIDWLRNMSRLEIVAPLCGMRPAPGKVYIAPSEGNMKMGSDGTILLEPRNAHDIFHPSCNALLVSVAAVFGTGSIGVILTGMGDDGVEGMKRIKEAGGATIAQDRTSCLIYGMPKVAVDSGCIDRVLPVGKVAAALVELATRP